MKSLILILPVFLAYGNSIYSQAISAGKTKVYNVWVKQDDNPVRAKGRLYLVTDTSIFISAAQDTLEYSFRDIDILKVRRSGTIKTGAIAGSSIGFTTGVIWTSVFSEELGVYTLPVSIIFGTYGALAGGFVGIFAGLYKDPFPVKNSFNNFEKYKGNLIEYSIEKEDRSGLKLFNHRFYADLCTGLSFAQNAFTTEPLADYPAMDRSGHYFSFSGGYRFTELAAVNICFSNRSYYVDFVTDYLMEYRDEVYWYSDSYMISPILTLPFKGNKIRMDLKPRIGYVSNYLLEGDNEIMTGEGFGFYPGLDVNYDYSKRWAVYIDLSYLYSRQKYDTGGSGKVSVTDMGIGLSYKFGKRSL